jgi:hypothetical protein
MGFAAVSRYLVPVIITVFVGYFVISFLIAAGDRFISRTKMLLSCSSQTLGLLQKTELKQWDFHRGVKRPIGNNVNPNAQVQPGDDRMLMGAIGGPGKSLQGIIDKLVRGVKTEVVIDYQVDGQDYQSCWYYPGQADETYVPFWESLEGKKNEVNAGEKYTVYYDPSNPSNAFMVRGWPKGEIASIVFLIGLALAFGLVALKSRLCFLAIGSAIYSAGLFLFGPASVLVSHLHLHLLVILSLSLVVWAFERIGVVKLKLSKSS